MHMQTGTITHTTRSNNSHAPPAPHTHDPTQETVPQAPPTAAKLKSSSAAPGHTSVAGTATAHRARGNAAWSTRHQCGVRARVAPLSTSHQHARPPHTLCLGRGSLNILLWRRLSACGQRPVTRAPSVERRLTRAPYEHPRHSGWAPSGSAASWDAELCVLRAARRARLRSRAGAKNFDIFDHAAAPAMRASSTAAPAWLGPGLRDIGLGQGGAGQGRLVRVLGGVRAGFGAGGVGL